MSYELVIKLYNFVQIPFTDNMYIVSSNEGIKDIEKLSPKSNMHRDNSFVAYLRDDVKPINGDYLVMIDEDGKVTIDVMVKVSKVTKEEILDATCLTTPVQLKFEKTNDKMWSQLFKIKLHSFKKPRFLIERENRGFPKQYTAVTDICTSKYLLSQLNMNQFHKSAYTYFVDYSIPEPKDGYYLAMLSSFEFNGETKYTIVVKEQL